jgi:hypothetical protein
VRREESAAVNTTPLYIFDLDGTLADLKHRRHFVALQAGSHVTVDGRAGVCLGPTRNATPPHWSVMLHDTLESAHSDARSVKFKPNWDAFHAACVDDTPIEPVIDVMKCVEWNESETWVWSGRSDSVRTQTVEWLARHTDMHSDWGRRLKMRPAGDYTPDDQLKQSWLHAMSPEDRARLVMVFDDRNRVVDMWRRNGVVCAQVAPGDF